MRDKNRLFPLNGDSINICILFLLSADSIRILSVYTGISLEYYLFLIQLWHSVNVHRFLYT